VPITVLRDGKRVSLSVTLTEKVEQVAANTEDGGGESNSSTERSATEKVGGLTVRAMSAEERSAAKLDKGVMVADVQEGSAAEQAGIQAGDVIQEVGGKEVNSPTEFAKMLRDAGGTRKHAVLLVSSPNEAPRFVALQIETR
jgi:serine protease Do